MAIVGSRCRATLPHTSAKLFDADVPGALNHFTRDEFIDRNERGVETLGFGDDTIRQRKDEDYEDKASTGLSSSNSYNHEVPTNPICKIT